MYLLKLFIYTLICLVKLKVQAKTNCFTKNTCGDCIQDVECIWCTLPYLSIANEPLSVHCANRDIERSTWCDPDNIVDPQNVFVIVENKALQTGKDGSVVQIAPQKVKVTLRKGEKFELPFQYRVAENYPVDLYYIMDLSASMVEHKEKLGMLGETLSETMRNLTNDFQIGFGSFVDKVDLPFTNTAPSALQSPCHIVKHGQTVHCIAPYSFKNHMSLTSNTYVFSKEVLNAKISGNLDVPEGGFDALMQAMVCKKEIRWRENARHIIVLSTDEEFHIAGDGKLAGIVEPNDAQCHLANGHYTHDRVYDYPSISQINYVAKQNNINLIFAIVKSKGNARVLKVYDLLKNQIENSAVAWLGKNSDNVVSLVAENYNKIVKSVVMEDNSENDIEIKYSSTCSKPKENGCSHISVGEIINFTATIKPLRCQQKGLYPRIIKIKPTGLVESLEIELTVACDCLCEQPDHPNYVKNSEKCSFRGDTKCGVCSCHHTHFGKNCECGGTEDVSDCVRNTSTAEICSGAGTCICGKCMCIQRSNPAEKIYGKFCECDNYSCMRGNGELCSGIKNGVCNCGRCECSPGWTGEACECSEANTTCITPESESSICSGNGKCECGQCHCNMLDGYKYSGKYCEKFPLFPGRRCPELQNCVECQSYKSGAYNETQCAVKCTDFTAIVVDEISEDDVDENIKICRIPDNLGCKTVYQYRYDDNNKLVVIVQKNKLC
ncbi:hypothetical protein FQA39_LY09664 [Lamprigera yunnana]|nr:hypothetical protein FQA39_LY09664 [Lamprigera yunnana]